MKTMLALLILASCQGAPAEDCWVPPKVAPCVPRLDGTPERARAEHLRCILMDNDALRGENAQLRIALDRCAKLHETDNWRFK